MTVLRKVVQIILFDDEEQQFWFWLAAEGGLEAQLPAYQVQRPVLGDDGRIYVRVPRPVAGQLPSSKGTLHTATAGAQSHIEGLSLVNEGAGDNTVTLYVHRIGGSSRKVLTRLMKSGDSIEIERWKTLAQGDLLEGMATNASEVTYDFAVREETPL